VWMNQALDKPVMKHGDFSFDLERDGTYVNEE